MAASQRRSGRSRPRDAKPLHLATTVYRLTPGSLPKHRCETAYPGRDRRHDHCGRTGGCGSRPGSSMRYARAIYWCRCRPLSSGRASRSAAWRDAFLRLLGERGSVTLAAEAAGFGKTTAYARRKLDSDFAEAWGQALATARGRIAGGATPRPASDEIVRASKTGCPCVMRAGPGRWLADGLAGLRRTLAGGAAAGLRAAEGAGPYRDADARGLAGGSARRRRAELIGGAEPAEVPLPGDHGRGGGRRCCDRCG